jgi:hypothetical protein
MVISPDNCTVNDASHRIRVIGVRVPAMDAKLAVDCFLFILTTGVALYAIRDTRQQVRDMKLLERNRVYSKVRTDIMWMYLNPTEQSHTAQIGQGIEEFCIMAQAVDPQYSPADLKAAIENEALCGAELLVKSGHGTWKPGANMAAINQKLLNWKTDRNKERIHNLLEKKFTLF